MNTSNSRSNAHAISTPGRRSTAAGCVSAAACFLVVGAPSAQALAQEPQGATADAASPSASALQVFNEKIAPVLVNPRCVNCHPQGDFPHQGDDSHRHFQNVMRGPDDHGHVALRCSTCHGDANRAGGYVPGAPKWALAPRAMAWEGLSAGEICRVMLDSTRNGGKSLERTVEHLTRDELVAWGWSPGARAPVPIPKDQFNDAVKRWAAAGAPCP